MLSELPRDLAEDVLSRVPATSMRAVRCVCRRWNTLAGDIYASRASKRLAQATKGFMAAMVISYRLYLKSVYLHGTHNDVDLSINHQGQLVSLTDSDRIDDIPIYGVYHCDGLLLCISFAERCDRLVVWNPCTGQTRWIRWIEPITCHTEEYSSYLYAIGYEDSKPCRSYKVLRFGRCFGKYRHVRYEIYNINSKSCRDISITILSDWFIRCYARGGVSLKGNTYWFAREKTPREDVPNFLICFNFTTERFGPRLSVPFKSRFNDTVTLSSVRDEQLAVLYQRHPTLHIEIGITTKIEPGVASWNKLFLAVDMEALTGHKFGAAGGSFFVDEEKKVAVVFDRDDETDKGSVAYIIGEDGYFKQVDFD